MMEQENTEPGTARTLEQLRSDADKSVSEARVAKDAWGEALQRQRRERDAQNGMATYGQMRELVGRQELAELKNGQRAQDAIASALAIASAPENKGRLPGVVTDYLNRQFGFDGKTAGITEGGIDPETGDFGFVFAERDEQGNTSYRKQTIPRSVQLGLMEGYPSLFNEEAVKAHRQKMLDSGLTSAELDAYSNVARLSRERLAKRMEELTPKEKTSGWSPERIELEKERLRLRENEEAGRNNRAGTKNDVANARLAASVAKHMNEIKMGLGLNDEQSAQLQSSLTKILSDAFAPAGGGQAPGDGGETSSNGQTGKKVSYNGLKPGQTFFATGKDGKRHKYRKTENGYERID